MKFFIKPWLVGLGSAIVGAVVGALTVGYFMSWFMNHGIQLQALVLSNTQLTALSSLRAGDEAKAAEILELSLDSQVLYLGATMEDMSDTQRARTTALLRKVRIYRTQHGVRSKNETIESMLNEFLEQAGR